MKRRLGVIRTVLTTLIDLVRPIEELHRLRSNLHGHTVDAPNARKVGQSHRRLPVGPPPPGHPGQPARYRTL